MPKFFKKQRRVLLCSHPHTTENPFSSERKLPSPGKEYSHIGQSVNSGCAETKQFHPKPVLVRTSQSSEVLNKNGEDYRQVIMSLEIQNTDHFTEILCMRVTLLDTSLTFKRRTTYKDVAQ
jgi:hypothetical protein